MKPQAIQSCLVVLSGLLCLGSAGLSAGPSPRPGAGLGAGPGTQQAHPAQQAPHAYTLSGDYQGTHDPSIIKEGNTWYVFATDPNPREHFPIRCSTDLQHWTLCGHVFQEIPQWIRDASPGTRVLWAPDISYFHGEYHLYYAYSLFGKNTSGIALATNKTLDPSSPGYKWVDHGLVFASHAEDDFNAIDPNLVLDTQGNAWLAFGSFWSGIKMRQLDPDTGKLSTQNTTLYSLAGRARPSTEEAAPAGLPPNWEAIEAPFIIHHGGYYYLFVSWDLCCRGTKSTYRTMVGRSTSVTGPYVDATGKPMMEGGGTPFLAANQRWLGPGGESLLIQNSKSAQSPKSEAGKTAGGDPDLVVFHAYDATTGKPAMQISTIAWKDGWPHAALAGDEPGSK